MGVGLSRRNSAGVELQRLDPQEDGDTAQKGMKEALVETYKGPETIQSLLLDTVSDTEDGYTGTPLHCLCRNIEAYSLQTSFNEEAQDLLDKNLTPSVDLTIRDSEQNTVLDVAVQMVVPEATLEKILNRMLADDILKDLDHKSVVTKLFNAIRSCERTVTSRHINALIGAGIKIFNETPKDCLKFILESPESAVRSAVRIAKVLNVCADKDAAHGPLFREKADRVEQMALELINSSSSKDEARWILTDEVVKYALDNDSKKFVATAYVQELFNDRWHGKVTTEDCTVAFLRTRDYVVKVSKYLLNMIIFPFLIIIVLPKKYGCDYGRFTKEYLEKVEPVVAFIANAVSFVIFLLFLIGNVIINNEVSRCDNLEKGKGCSLDVLDWIVFVFVLGLIAQEVVQFQKIPFSQYISSPANIIDIAVLFLFNTYYVLTMTGFYSSLDIHVRFQLVRASYHVLGFVALVCCIRFLPYLQVHPKLGPIQLSFRGIASRMLMFLIILGTFLVGFAVSLTSIYSARLYSIGKPANATAPYLVENFWVSLKSTFWVLFGLTDDTVFKSGSDVEDSAENIIGTILFAIWCVIAVIILLNMLIALICDSFQKVQDNADIEWKFARAWVIRDILEAPLIPVPINMIHHLARLVSFFCCLERNDASQRENYIFQKHPNKEKTKVANKSVAKKYEEKQADREVTEQSKLISRINEMTREFQQLKTKLEERLNAIETRWQ